MLQTPGNMGRGGITTKHDCLCRKVNSDEIQIPASLLLLDKKRRGRKSCSLALYILDIAGLWTEKVKIIIW